MVRQVSSPFLSRIGLRVMSESFSVSDTPSLQQFAGRPVPGAYEVDDEGVPAQDVPLVENGRLVMLLTNRTPNRNLPQSNGHARGNGPRPAWSRCARRANPRGRVEGETAGAAETPEQGLRLHRPQHRRAGVAADRQGDAGRGRADCPRGGRRRSTTHRFPRILEASSELTLYTYRTGGGPVSVIAPALLFEEIEIVETRDILQKAPRRPIAITVAFRSTFRGTSTFVVRRAFKPPTPLNGTAMGVLMRLASRRVDGRCGNELQWRN